MAVTHSRILGHSPQPGTAGPGSHCHWLQARGRLPLLHCICSSFSCSKPLGLHAALEPPPFDSRRPGQGAAETEAFPIPVRMEKESSHLNLCFRAYASTNGAVYRGTCFTLVRFILLHLFMPSSVAAGLKINFCTPAAASRSCLVITPCETRTSRSSRMNLHRQQESYLQPGTRLGVKCSYAVTFGCFLQIVPHYAQQLQLFGY